MSTLSQWIDAERTAYEVLGVSEDSDLNAIKKAHRKLALLYHPDRQRANDSDTEAARDNFQRIQTAYGLLSDVESRVRYDAQLKRSRDKTEFRGRKRHRDFDENAYPAVPPTPSKSTVLQLDNQDIRSSTSSLSSSSEVLQSIDRDVSKPELSTSPSPEALQSMDQDVREPEPSTFPSSEALQLIERDIENLEPALSSSSEAPQSIDQDVGEPELSTSPGSLPLRSNDWGVSKFEGWKGQLNNHNTFAIADTGADGNFVSERVAAMTGLDLEILPKPNRPSFVMAHGKEISPTAKACAMWRFTDDHEAFKLEFFVLRDCVFDVMLGADFVYQTSLLTNNRFRTTEFVRPVDAVHIRLVNTCGRPRQRLTGVVRRVAESAQVNTCLALPDSAAEPNLVSYAYADTRGWLKYMEPSPPHCRLLQFVDGSVGETEGRLWLCWRFDGRLVPPPDAFRASHGARTPWSGYRVRDSGSQILYWPPTTATRKLSPRRRNTYRIPIQMQPEPEHIGPFPFDVLRNCPWNVILGHVFLDNTQAFTAHAWCFTAVTDKSPLSINPVTWINSKKKAKIKNNVVASPLPDPLRNAMDALALRYEEERRQKRKLKIANAHTSSTPNSSTSSTTAAGSSI